MNAIALPQPALARWQPLRLGLVDLYLYDSEEFWFRNGRLLLRGNNGTGKSKVLSLTLPFLFDAQIKPSRIEPDGDPGKKMAWNLLMGKHERRTGYVWAEFGRRGEDGRAHFVTLGCGLSAVAARQQIDAWYFVADDTRVGESLWLTSPQGVVLSRERLQEALGARGQVFPSAEAYRRAVDERLFRLGAARYLALMDTLIQLRQPQLSKRPDEANLSEALTEALPPLPAELLGDVADALNQLEEYRQELESFDALAKAVGQFNQRYRVYARINARREAGKLRAAQTEFDKASQALNDAKEKLAAAQAEESRQTSRHDELASKLTRTRAAYDALREDPALQDARRLDEAKRQAEDRRRDAELAANALQEAEAKVGRETRALEQRAARAIASRDALAEAHARVAAAAEACGLAADLAQEAADLNDAEVLSCLENAAWQAAQRQLRGLTARRRTHLGVVRRLLRNVEDAHGKVTGAQQRCDERTEAFGTAAERRRAADEAVELQGALLVDAWQSHFDRLEQLRPADPDTALAALAEWVVALQGDNPARTALSSAQNLASERFAGRAAALAQRERELAGERDDLSAEKQRLEQGEDASPPAPYFRDGAARLELPGAPLWQLLEFREPLSAPQRAGLEAALEASGLLDAWVTPDGSLLAADGAAPWHDTQIVARPRQTASAADWLLPAEHSAVAAPVIAALLESIACGTADAAEAEAWIAPDGRFRLGPLAGAWNKPSAEYIGYAARAAARARRLDEIARRLSEIDASLSIVADEKDKLGRQRERAALEWNTAPSDEELRAAHVAAVAAAKAFAEAEEALRQAQARLAEAEQHWRAARERLVADAADLHLPVEPAALDAIEAAVNDFGDQLQQFFLAAQDVRHALPEWLTQQRRVAEAQGEEDQRREQSAERHAQAEDAQARWQALYDAVGLKVEEIQRRIADLRHALAQGEKEEKAAEKALREAGETRAKAQQKEEDCVLVLEERRVQRQATITVLQAFTASGLMSIAVPDLECPDPAAPWTIDPALTLARRAEQALAGVKADDEDWTRIQNRISEDFGELLRSLGALGHQAHAATSDHGLIVSVVYRNRPERPDRLEAILAEEIAQRRELLTANERELLENHLQAEVASAIQRMLQEADRHVDGINAELERRPTSTGVRFRLVWEALPEGSDGAPVGLDAARRKLLNTSADAWSAEDRRVVGDMLQSRIAAERARADAGGGSLLEQLGRALDYRRWHRFRVERWQGGKWGRLSGPASSGERALGLTVPLFAAVSSHYSQGGHDGYAGAPRLVLLDEAFAGIDREARAHCMALIREFDLDFVMTSESEWGCYAELPGVSICHLLRREGIDAVHVSRWTWDGRTRREEPDPGRRFPSGDLRVPAEP
ncbi:TIGR02680 family protein [Methylococcus sp. Mc7]|uniref:TIGR02680 family protein n=1 Tax=Methylococcus sp. Mc7 TaxID=2860258 RepID=UPI001C53201B|nr:TIGR02680 family protein [Methylococcus sp. Mc7]QXP85028.1 TIGR02680 family protein [Methylococcus sp. Mc7]